MGWAPDYVTTTELADYLDADKVADQVSLQMAISAASRSVDKYCRRQFGQVPGAVVRYYTARWCSSRSLWVVDIDDLMVSVGINVVIRNDTGDYDSVPTGWTLYPFNALRDGFPFTELALDDTTHITDVEGNVKIFAQFGWDATPTPVRQATLMQASRLWKRRDAPFGIAGSPESGSEMRLLSKLDPDVEHSLKPFRKSRGLFA